MNSTLNSLIEEKISIDFHGAILLKDEISNCDGKISFDRGKLHYAKLGLKKGVKALLQAFIREKQILFRVSSSPEKKTNIQLPYFEILEEARKALSAHQHYQQFTIPSHIKLFPNPRFIESGAKLEKDEYKVLLKISEKKTKNMAKELDLLDYEITKALMALRNKKAFMTKDSE